MIRLSEEYDVHVHIVHVSAAEALPLIRAAKKRGLRITAETCPHYLVFCAEDIPDGATEYKCCLLYTSDAADERSSVDLGGRRIIKKKNKKDIDSHA